MSDDNVVQGDFEVTDEGIQGLIDGTSTPEFHTVLEVWQQVLKPAADEMTAKVLPQWASRIIGQYTGITYADMERFRDLYYGKIVELAGLLDEEIATDDECFNNHTPEDDVEHNSAHYFNVLLAWQVRMMEWELAWETTSPDAAIELAALSEVHKMFFGQQGITQFLDNIKYEFTEHDQAKLATALDELKAGARE